jgi:mRNA-degrading endonuclease toxin of MazEF toxin-antitoxin module
MNQGEISLVESPTEKPRPVLIVTRSEAIPVLNAIIVAPLTTTVRDIPTRRLGALGTDRRHELCAALTAMSDC